MNKRMKWLRWMEILAVAATVSVWSAGCDDDDEDYDHVSPAGQGTLVVDNNTPDRVRVFVDGVQAQSVGKGDERYYDLDPGDYRIALDGEDSDRFWTGDADILQGRLTILKVSDDLGDFDDFDVDIDFD